MVVDELVSTSSLTPAELARLAEARLAECGWTGSTETTEEREAELVDALRRARELARRRHEYEVADALRAHLSLRSLWIEDHPDGSSTVKAVLPGKLNATIASQQAGKALRELAQTALEASMEATSLEEVVSAARAAAAESLALLRAVPGGAAGSAVLQGRQHSDVALKLALAGVDNPEIFRLLGEGATAELQRIASKTPPVAVAQTIERCATAGFRQEEFPELFQAAAEALGEGSFENTSTAQLLASGSLALLSERPLLWIFRHAQRQGRRSAPPEGESGAYEAVAGFNAAGDRETPLVLDLGCGFGACSLGLAADPGRRILAVEASAHCLGFARSVASRWQVPSTRLRFEHCSALAALQAVTREFQGPLEWILVNFPTPFAATTDDSRNLHLPSSAEAEDFMVNKHLLAAAHHCVTATGGTGRLLVQSNVEDVALTIRDLARSVGWSVVEDGSLGPEVDSPQGEPGGDDDPGWLPRRHLQHAESGLQRATGPGWLRASPLPAGVRSETESYYESEGLPIHRVALRLSDRGP